MQKWFISSQYSHLVFTFGTNYPSSCFIMRDFSWENMVMHMDIFSLYWHLVVKNGTNLIRIGIIELITLLVSGCHWKRSISKLYYSKNEGHLVSKWWPSHTRVRLSHDFKIWSDFATFKIGTGRSDFENRQVCSHIITIHRSRFYC